MKSNTDMTGYARSGELKIFYRRFGGNRGMPIVIVHGLSYFSYDWIGIASALASKRPVVAIDMRGFGESDWSVPGNYSPEANSADLIAVLDALGWQQAALLGHSMGGRHCTYCAFANKERVAGLISVDFAPAVAPAGSARVASFVGNTPDHFRTVEDAMTYLNEDSHTSVSEQARSRLGMYLKETDKGLAIKRDPYFKAYFKQILETGKRPPQAIDFWAVLRSVSCPTLIVRGTESDMFSADIAAKLLSDVPAAQLVEITAGHNIPGEAPEQLIEVVDSFMADVDHRSNSH